MRKHRRQCPEQRARGALVAGEIAANESRRLAVAAVAHLNQALELLGPDRSGRKLEIGAEDMPVVTGEQEKIAGFDLYLLAPVHQARPA
jgi:hypothetical protein